MSNGLLRLGLKSVSHPLSRSIMPNPVRLKLISFPLAGQTKMNRIRKKATVTKILHSLIN